MLKTGFLLSSHLVNSLAGLGTLGWKSFSFIILRASLYCLLVSRVPVARKPVAFRFLCLFSLTVLELLTHLLNYLKGLPWFIFFHYVLGTQWAL